MKTKNAMVATLLLGSAGVANGAASNLDVSWSIETGLGYETNAYHAPDHSYADYYADPTGATIINPVEQDGFFIPLNVKVELSNPLTKGIDLVGDYRLYSTFHPDSALQDANSTTHKLSVGGNFHLGKTGKEGKAYAGVFVHSQDKVYVDRDSGEPKLSAAGIDVSNRYTYTSFGVEGEYEHKITAGDNVGVAATYEDLNYSDPVVWTQYDHVYTMLRAYWEHKFATSTKLTLGATSEVRDYSARHAYDANGTLLASNPLLTYTYTGYDVGVRHRFTDSTIVYFDYDMTQRRDSNVGYNDMDETRYKVRVIHDLNDKTRLRAKLAYLDRNYLNAFNFEDPTRGSKSSSGTDIELRGEYAWNKHKTYYLELAQNSRDNTDDRYQYLNNTVMLGAKWEY